MVAVARAVVPFDLKSTDISGLALVLRTTDLASLAATMAERFGSTEVFGHEPVVIDLAGLDDAATGAVDFAGLVKLLETHRLRPAGVRGGSAALLAQAYAAGLGDVGDDPASVPVAGRQATPASAAMPVATPASESTSMSAAAPPSAPPPPPAEPAPPPAGHAVAAPTVIVDRPLRSGQQVYAKGGDLVVLATVNVGAEVIADGSIHVYGPLRGKAVAGAKGNVEARIFSTCMEPQLLAIAGTYRTTENPLPADVVGKPAQIRLDGERLVFEPLA